MTAVPPEAAPERLTAILRSNNLERIMLAVHDLGCLELLE